MVEDCKGTYKNRKTGCDFLLEKQKNPSDKKDMKKVMKKTQKYLEKYLKQYSTPDVENQEKVMKMIQKKVMKKIKKYLNKHQITEFSDKSMKEMVATMIKDMKNSQAIIPLKLTPKTEKRTIMQEEKYDDEDSDEDNLQRDRKEIDEAFKQLLREVEEESSLVQISPAVQRRQSPKTPSPVKGDSSSEESSLVHMRRPTAIKRRQPPKPLSPVQDDSSSEEFPRKLSPHEEQIIDKFFENLNITDRKKINTAKADFRKMSREEVVKYIEGKMEEQKSRVEEERQKYLLLIESQLSLKKDEVSRIKDFSIEQLKNYLETSLKELSDESEELSDESEELSDESEEPQSDAQKKKIQKAILDCLLSSNK